MTVLTREYVSGIEQEFAGHRGRDRAFIQDVAERYCASVSIVESLARAFDRGRAITESDEGDTMPKSTTETRAQAIVGAVRLHGTGPKAVTVIRHVLGCTESEAVAHARQISEAASSTAVPAAEDAAASRTAEANLDATNAELASQQAAIARRAELAAMSTGQLQDTVGRVYGEACFGPATARESAPAEPTSTFESELAEATGGRTMKDLTGAELERLADGFVPR